MLKAFFNLKKRFAFDNSFWFDLSNQRFDKKEKSASAYDPFEFFVFDLIYQIKDFISKAKLLTAFSEAKSKGKEFLFVNSTKKGESPFPVITK